MICSKCGKELSPGSKFCSHCGAKMVQEDKKDYRNILIAILALCVLVLTGFLMMNVLTSKKESTSVETRVVEATKEKEKEEEKSEEKSVKEEKVEVPSAPVQQAIFGYGNAPASWIDTYYVSVEKGYLALRTAMAYDQNNELGAMYNGQPVYALDQSYGYWYVYSPTLGMYGYTNANYLVSGSTLVQDNVYYASVQTGYLALRTGMSYDVANEIGEIYSGQPVEVVDYNTGTEYWYVYAPTLGAYGYVNANYLVR